MASIRDTLASLFAKESPSAIQGTPLGNAYPNVAQPEAPLEAPPFSPDDLIGTGIGKAALAGGAKLAPLLLGHTAFHGSPHVFDKFMLEKLGTGEGAQSFGHGMYFAENPEIAQQYQKSLSQNALINKETGKTFSPYDLDARVTIQSGLSQGLSNEEIAKKIESAANEYEKIGGIPKQITAPKLRNEAEMARKGIFGTTEGQLYKVDIPDEHIPKMLDWDKPINEQSIEVRKSLAPYIEQYGLPMNEPGRSAHSMMLDIIGKREGLGSSSSPAAFKALAPKAAEELNKAGIKGIKYLDATSRDLGKGTHNFVVFDPSEVQILNKSKKLSDLLQQ